MSTVVSFEKGKAYQRKRLHDNYGGQRQGGISTSAKYPIIMLFDTTSGHEYGYRDGFTEDGIYEWTGEGQTGVMKLSRGNRAIHNHLEDGKKIHLFQESNPGWVRYIGEMVSVGYFLHDGVDRDGNLRKLIVFNLAPVETPREQLDEFRMRTLSQTSKSPKRKQKRILLCPRCGKEYSIEEHGIIRFCIECGSFLSQKIKFE
ncbi:hypothetical protein MCGE09_00267 [Thaumarchaeota archaeon SCGC AB-539-E09]|nr:hypothetical protein MCGE09_00267 [Thaumarchaeota archaeon SCGC AB-539-E09]